ncbi:acyl-CoA dehydrogenase [Streptomyces sp. DSM 44915]|uniref:Acyl-CoA dehydrogenase n=1 Tax=Streptomyces chisholmiae TaxID=3075540 RepID=A0ABU2JQW6_9ACTN|nr:acyl-CoA dehydrogenase [Streptomyces sp. DSM 44915]MDT0267374.1 acyl-CoA dehydrogenase [Streptomyces sp. DSM 44915]
MIELDARLRAIRDTHREAAADLRARALAIDTDPDAMAEHLDSPTYALIRESSIPAAHRAPDAAARPDRGTCLESIVGLVELFQGDVATLLACPSPALAGVFVELLGDEEQKARFYGRLADGQTWSCFAMSEEAAGNDATAMTSRLTPDGAGGWLLHGAKRYIGHGARAGVGVVFARTGRSALSIRAVLVELPLPGWHAERLEMVGLRGAYLSELRFDGVPIPGDALLGQHLPVTRRGIWGAMTTFHNMRMQLAAAAVGTSLAMAEYVAEHRKTAAGLPLVLARAEAARQLVYQAAAQLDVTPERGYLSSVAKLGATRLATDIARWAGAALGPAGLVEHPLLEKWTRDVRALEFMDGTSNIQRLHIARGHQSGHADD